MVLDPYKVTFILANPTDPLGPRGVLLRHRPDVTQRVPEFAKVCRVDRDVAILQAELKAAVEGFWIPDSNVTRIWDTYRDIQCGRLEGGWIFDPDAGWYPTHPNDLGYLNTLNDMPFSVPSTEHVTETGKPRKPPPQLPVEAHQDPKKFANVDYMAAVRALCKGT